MVFSSSPNAYKIIQKGLESGKKIFFVPDRCLGQNFAKSLNLKSAVIGDGSDLKEADIICYNGFCSVHQQFSVEDIEFYREKFPDILIAVHPECDPSVCDKADFVGSTSQLIEYIKGLDEEQKIAVGTEFNMVNRLRTKNTYILSSTKPECPTMNETTLEDVIVFEMQAYGLNGTTSNPRFVPAEYDILVWNLTKALTDSGRIVVAAAGNGYQDLDSLDYQTYMG